MFIQINLSCSNTNHLYCYNVKYVIPLNLGFLILNSFQVYNILYPGLPDRLHPTPPVHILYSGFQIVSILLHQYILYIQGYQMCSILHHQYILFIQGYQMDSILHHRWVGHLGIHFLSSIQNQK